MTNKIRNVTKQLLGAEDVLFGRGTVSQRRGTADVSVHRLDLALPVADEAELAVTDPEQYPKASIGSRNFVAVNGQYQEVSTIQPVLFSVGAMMSAEYPYAIDGDTVAKWTGAFPKTLTLADKGFTSPGWQVTSTGLGRAIISETVPSASFTREGVRWYKPSESTTYVYYCDGDSCQWVQEPVQSAEGTLRQELAASNSSVLVGGAEAGKIAKRSDAGFRTIEEFGGGVSVADNTAAWQALLASGAKWVHFGGNGGYKFLSHTTHNSDIIVTMSEGAFIDCTDAAFSGPYWTKFSGSRSNLPALNASVSRGSYQVTFASAHDLQPGDVFFIFNPTASSWSGWRPVYFSGEFCEVAAVSGNTVRLINPLYSSYTAAAVNVYKLNPVEVIIGNLDIRGDKSISLVEIEFGRNCYVKDFKASHKNNSVLQFIRCYNSYAENPSIFNTGTGIGDDYGIVITNSQTLKIKGGKAHARRHAITAGGDGEVGAVPCRDLLIDSVTLSNDPNSDVFAADFHGNTENAKYVNCTIYGGATWQGKNNGYENCVIYSMLNGVCIYSSEIVGGTLFARNCDFISLADPSAVSRGVIDIGGNNEAINSNTAEKVTLDLTGSSLNSIDFSAITSIMLMRNRGSNQKINIKIDDLTLDVNNFGQILFTALNSGTANSDFIVVDNIKSSITGKFLCNHSGDSYRDFPHKLQSQSGRQSINTNTGASQVAGTTQELKWQYPRLPDANVHAVNVGYIGTKLPQAYLDIGALTATRIRPWLATPDQTNFASAQAVDVRWSVEINEI